MKPRKLEDRLMLAKPLKDENGRYLPYCDFGWHQGIVKPHYKKCEQRRCGNYRKLYIPKHHFEDVDGKML